MFDLLADADSDRGISVAVTHVLTIGITTILIAMLLTSGATLLETETERSAEASLETIGERLADEIENVDRIAAGEADNVTVTAEHPRAVANSRYTVELVAFSECREAPLLDGSTDCLRLRSQDTDVTVYVPVSTDADLDTGRSVSGGPIAITHENGEITIENETE